MKTFEELRDIIQKNKFELELQFKIKKIGIFGSYVRGEQKKTSDIDILVEFKDPIGLIKFIVLEERLEELLGVKVDLVSKKALKNRIGEHIRNEVIYT